MAKSKQRGKTVTVSAIRALSQLQVSEAEAAASLGIQLKTFREIIRIDALAREAWEQGRELGKVSLRRAQFAMAQRHPQMAIFLGKQYLGQNEIQVIEHSGRDGGPIKTLDLNRLDSSGRKQLRTILEQARVKK
jgi:hypothetical protein